MASGYPISFKPAPNIFFVAIMILLSQVEPAARVGIALSLAYILAKELVMIESGHSSLPNELEVQAQSFEGCAVLIAEESTFQASIMAEMCIEAGHAPTVCHTGEEVHDLH